MMIGVICGLLGAIAFYCGIHAAEAPVAAFLFMSLAAMMATGVLAAGQNDRIPMGFKGSAPDSVYRFAHLIGNVVALTSPRPELTVTDLPLYLGTDAGIKPAGGILLARLAGAPALIIEQSSEEDTDAQTEQQ
jgi:hypothetical protein